jgi:hypothetical protein
MNNARKAILIIMLLEEFIGLMTEYEPNRTAEQQRETLDSLIMVGIDVEWAMSAPSILLVKELSRILGGLDFTMEDIDKEMIESEQNSTFTN